MILQKKVLVSSSYISKVEAGKEIPSDIFLKLISLEFGISYDWLKTGDDNSKEAFTKVENVTHINKIKEVRKKNNMTQQEFANSLGISRPHLSKKIESSKENKSDSVIKLISKLYDVSYDWLTSLDETCADEAVANTKHCKEVMNNKIFIGMEIKIYVINLDYLKEILEKAWGNTCLYLKDREWKRKTHLKRF